MVKQRENMAAADKSAARELVPRDAVLQGWDKVDTRSGGNPPSSRVGATLNCLEVALHATNLNRAEKAEATDSANRGPTLPVRRFLERLKNRLRADDGQ